MLHEQYRCILVNIGTDTGILCNRTGGVCLNQLLCELSILVHSNIGCLFEPASCRTNKLYKHYRGLIEPASWTITFICACTYIPSLILCQFVPIIIMFRHTDVMIIYIVEDVVLYKYYIQDICLCKLIGSRLYGRFWALPKIWHFLCPCILETWNVVM